MQRPEEPSEWAGLPGEPLRPRSPAEVLPDDGPVDAASAGLLGVGDVPFSSISVPLEVVQPRESDVSPAPDAEDAEED